MGCIQLLLLGSLWFSSIFSSVDLSVAGASQDGDDVVETTFKHLCEGMEVELRNCNERLVEKTEYSAKIETDLFVLKRQLRQVRLTCQDAAQSAMVQISALQTQLDSMLQQLGEKATGPAAAVLNALQKFNSIKKLEMDITMETNPGKIAELEEQLKEAKAELNEMSANMSQSTCSAPDYSQVVEVIRLQEEVEELRRGDGGSASASRLSELQRQLEEKLKALEQTDDTSQVAEIIRRQEDTLATQSRLAELLAIEAKFTALQERLREKMTLLSDLKEEKEEKGSNRKLDNQIAAVENEVSTLEDELEALNRSLALREELEELLSAKRQELEEKSSELKDDQKLIPMILRTQFKLQQTRIHAHAEKKAAVVQITDLQNRLRMKQDRISELLASNQYLENKLADQMAECDDLQAAYDKVSGEVDKMINNLPDSKLKQVLEIVSLNIDIDNIQSSIANEKSQPKIKALQKELEDKINQLNSMKKELQGKDPDAGTILRIIEKMEEIQKLQNQAVNADSLGQINILHQELLTLIDRLDDSSPAKLVLKNMAMLSDVNWLNKLITSVTQQAQQKTTALEELVNEKEELLNRKIAELTKKDSNVDQLTKEVLALREDKTKLQDELRNLDRSSAAQLQELQTRLNQSRQELDKVEDSLKTKDAELAKKVNRITELIEELRQTKNKAQEKDKKTTADMKALEERLQKSEKEKSDVEAQNKKLLQDLEEAKQCTELQESYNELQAKFDKEVSQLNNSLAAQVLTIQTLSADVENIQEKLNTSEGNTDDLKEQLQKKNAALEKTKKELKKSTVDFAELMKVLESTRKLNRQQKQSISAYLAEINKLEMDTEDLMAKLRATGDEKAQQTIQVIILKEQLASLEKLQAGLKKEALEKVGELEKYIEEKNKEISYLRKSGCGGDQIKSQITQLEKDVRAKEKELDQLKKSTNAEVQQLGKKITETAGKLESSEAKLKEKDEQNVDLIKRLADLAERLKEAQSGTDAVKQTMQEQIDGLKQQVKNKEREVSDLRSSNADFKEQLKNKQRDVSDLQNQNRALNKELGMKQEVLDKAEQEVKDKEATIANLRTQLREVADKDDCKDVLDENSDLKQQLKAAKDKLQEIEDRKLVDDQITVVSPELDPDTAHARLLLSHGDQRVRGSEYSRAVPNNPERYDSALAAVAKTGYNSGRQYWEVQVQDRACFVVGVAKESAQRKGELRYGPRNGYWGILRRKDGRYLALTDQPTSLSIGGKLNVIGILLEFSKGEVSFYNAKFKRLLYSFRGNVFTEKLYPYIETCTDQSRDDPPIIISRPQSILYQGLS